MWGDCGESRFGRDYQELGLGLGTSERCSSGDVE